MLYRFSLSGNCWSSWRVAFCAVALLGAISCAEAQNAATISGVVVDPSAAVVADAAVVLRSRMTHEERESRTDWTGAFAFGGLPFGNYDLEVRMAGFDAAKARVEATHSTPTALRIVLPLSQVQTDLTVNGVSTLPSTAVEENLDTISINQGLLHSLPLLSGDIMGLASRLIGPGGHPTIIVDGIETPLTRLHPSQIQSLRINQNPYSAEYSGPGSSRIEITTVADDWRTSAFHGSVDFSLRNALFDARNAFAPTRPSEQHQTFDANLSGPLGDKKTSFDANFWRDAADLQSIVYAVTPNGTNRENVPNSQRNIQGTFGVNRQIGGKDSMSFRYNYTTWTNLNSAVGGFVLPEAGVDIDSPSQDFTYNYTALLSTKLINVLNVQGIRNSTTTQSRLRGVPQTDVIGAFTSGGAQADFLQTRTSLALTDTLSWSRGVHSMRAGVVGPKLDRIGYDDRRNLDGTYSFSSLADYQLGRPFSFIQQEGNGSLIFHGVSAAAFVQDNIQLRRNFSVGIGVRYEWQRYLKDYNNLLPRLSFAYSPGSRSKTVLRGGIAVFSQAAPWEAIADTFRFNGYRLRQIVLSDPTYPNPFATVGSASIQPPSVVELDPRLRTPYLIDYSFSAERQIGKATFTATYNGQQALKQFRSADLNAPLPPLFLARPNPALTILRQIESSGRGDRDSFRLGYRGQMTRFFSGTAFYVLSRAYSNTEGINYFAADQYNQSGEWARTGTDQRHTFLLMGSLDAGSWVHFGLVSSIGSGLPYTLTTGQDDNHDSRPTDRPPGVPRNSLELPWSATVDLRWSKEFYLAPSQKEKGPSATINVDAFNLLNRVNITSIVSSLNSPLFGLPVAAQSARRLQFSLEFKF